MDCQPSRLAAYWVYLQLLIMTVCGLQQFSQRPQNLDVIKGQMAVIKCAVENRKGNIQWAKGSTNPIMLGFARQIPGFGGRYSVIGDDRTEFNLQIVNTDLSDDDDFHCQVGPADGDPPLMAKAHLTVLVPPTAPEIENYASGSRVEVKHTEPVLQLTCKSNRGKPAAVIKWFRNSDEITEGVVYTAAPISGDKREDATSVLTLRPTYPNDNNVNVTCQAYNNALINGPLRTTVVISVLYPPDPPVIQGYKVGQVVRVGDTVAMTCESIGGNPTAQVAWYKGSAQVDYLYHSTPEKAYNELILTAQKTDNNAEYRCEAWNLVNAAKPLSVTQTIIVHFAPTKASITGTREAKAGETLTLTCTTSNSNPAAVITWIPQGVGAANSRSRTEASPDGGFITISDIDITLTGQQTNAIYTCSATNHELGVTVADTATVGVLYPPEPPMITGYNEGEAVKAGNVLKMRCTALRGNPPATLVWKKGDVDMTEVRNMTAGNIPSLEVSILTKPDDNNAIYKCLASNRATETPLEALRKVSVHFSPTSVNITSEPLIARAGQQLHLTCISRTSNPPAVITWMHNNRQMTGTNLGHTDAEFGGKSTKNVLEFTPTSADHDTAYGCRASNLAIQESVHDAITLNVRFKPEFRGKEASIVINAGESRVVDLSATANPSNSTYQLKRGTTIVNQGDIGSFSLEGGVLTISAISKDDAGQFTIVAINAEGMSSFDFNINVQYPAEITEANAVEGDDGTSVTLKCHVKGNPMVAEMVTWKRDNFDMTRTLSSYADGVGSLLIESLQRKDSGSFTCIADNRIGSPVEKTVALTVKFTPEIDKAPEFNKAASQTGRTGRLICRAQGAPTVTFQWQKDGVNIAADSVKYEIQEKVTESIEFENVLLIKNVQKSDYGMYQCIVTNEKGEDRLPVVFDDTTKPDPPRDVEFVNATHNSLTVRWKAGFDGGLTQTFRVRYKVTDMSAGYTYVDVLPPDANIFTVKGLSLGTDYELTVMAHNELGGSDYAAVPVIAKTSNLKPKSDVQSEKEEGEDMPVIIILVVCVVGILLLALNIGLILFFVRRRKKRMERLVIANAIPNTTSDVNNSDTTSNTNTMELYGPTKETQLYPIHPTDESRSYGTNDKYTEDDYSDDYKSYEQGAYQIRVRHSGGLSDCACLGGGGQSSSASSTSWKDNCCFDPGEDDLKRVFLPPPEYGGVTYSHNKLDSPTFDHRHPMGADLPYGNGSDTDSCRKSPWQYEDAYKPSARGKGTFDSDYADSYRDQHSRYVPNGRLGGGLHTRPKSITELSERSSRPSSRGTGQKTPPPPPTRSSSKGAVEHAIPPLPARNYESTEAMPRYVPAPGSSSYGGSMNVIANPSYDGPSVPTSSHQPADPTDDMRGYLV
ncbi:nephrin-like isoform X3 [Dreissena polymorpha]|uniref:nephrin-like isoform X3 n=1 Tax=Dreissena polymorpha TaxID=45954 RepID=UPI0022643EA4|nr:nephrin-like isoform X3 [Dreissena polymorpha]